MKPRPLRLLHAEDNISDAHLTRMALSEGDMPFELDHVLDGAEALQFLRHQPPHTDAARPDLILLDLNMPGMSGHEALREIKEDPELKSIPVLVLTTSISPEDVTRSYESHVNSYMRKPVGFKELVDLMGRLEGFWHGAAVLPPPTHLHD